MKDVRIVSTDLGTSTIVLMDGVQIPGVRSFRIEATAKGNYLTLEVGPCRIIWENDEKAVRLPDA